MSHAQSAGLFLKRGAAPPLCFRGARQREWGPVDSFGLVQMCNSSVNFRLLHAVLVCFFMREGEVLGDQLNRRCPCLHFLIVLLQTPKNIYFERPPP